MCKVGGGPFRCASDTRKDVIATRKALDAARDTGNPDLIYAAHEEWKHALCDHASTPLGLKEILARVDALDEAGKPERADFFRGIANTGDFLRDVQQTAYASMLEDAAAAAAAKGESFTYHGVSREGLRYIPNFYPVQSSQWDGQMSGWKAHITTFDTDEAFDAWQRIADVVEAHGLAVKFAGPRVHHNWGLGDQQGKGLTVYFPHRETVEEDMYAIVNAMDGWHHDDPPNGDLRIAPGIGARWEYGNEDYGRDLPQREYEQMYVSARGEFAAPESATRLLGRLAPSQNLAPARM